MDEELSIPTVLRKNLPPNLEKIKHGHYVKSDKDYPVHLYLQENDITVEETGSDIVKFLKGKHILVTGATGFLGKLMVEKLLRSCRDIGRVYVLVRTKKGKGPEDRIKEYLENLVFLKLSHINPNFKEKVSLISGDLEEDDLGISDASKKLIRDKVNIIYHVGATVRFDEKLKKAVKINIQGTQQLLELAKGCKNLDLFCYVSTAFSNCTNKEIKETFYPAYLDPDLLMALIEKMPEDTLERITPGLLGPVPNTYVFTKQIAEDIIRRESTGLPVCIYRPAIVISSVREPVKSWIDNIYGPIGLILASLIGLLHIAYTDYRKRANLVPADYVINSCIATSFIAATKRKDAVQIFNYTTASKQPLRWSNLGMSIDTAVTIGSTRVLMKGFCRSFRSYPVYMFQHYIFHMIPAYIIDSALFLLGKKPMLIEGYKKINKFFLLLSCFTLNEWNFDDNNTTNVWQSLNNIDQKNFPFDMNALNWQEYFDTFVLAIREFLMKECLDNLEEGRKYKKQVDIVFWAFLLLIICAAVYFLIGTMFFFIPLMMIATLLFMIATHDTTAMLGY